MKNLVLLFTTGVLAFSQVAHAQNILPSYSQTTNLAASTASYEYRYTRHTRGGSGRGGGYHSTTYYTWDRYTDQLTSVALPVAPGVTQQVTTQGTFYGPTYSATAAATSSLSNTPAGAILNVNYGGASTVTTTLGANKAVIVAAQPSGSFTFTTNGETNISVSTNGNAGGVFSLIDGTTHYYLYTVSGANSTVLLGTAFPPGTYTVNSSLSYTSGVDTLLGTTTNPGTTSTTWGFTLTVVPTEPGGTGGAGGSGGSGGSGGGDNSND